MKTFLKVVACFIWLAGVAGTAWACSRLHEIGWLRAGSLGGLIAFIALFGGAHLFFLLDSEVTARSPR